MALQFFAYCINHAREHTDTSNIYSFAWHQKSLSNNTCHFDRNSYESILRPKSFMEIETWPCVEILVTRE